MKFNVSGSGHDNFLDDIQAFLLKHWMKQRKSQLYPVSWPRFELGEAILLFNRSSAKIPGTYATKKLQTREIVNAYIS
jgi:hypothetical protein